MEKLQIQQQTLSFMLDFGQKVSLESFQLWFVIFFPDRAFFFSKNRAYLRNWRDWKKNSQAIMDIIFGNFSTFLKNFDPLHVKRYLIPSIKHGIKPAWRGAKQLKDIMKAYFIAIRCSRLWLWVGCFIYFKLTPVFF